MDVGDGVAGTIMLGFPGPDYRCPRRAEHVTHNIYVYVDDVGQHYDAAKAAGAEMLSELEDTFYGDRRYGAADVEGHHWYFAQKLREVDAKDWRPSDEDLKGHG